MKKRTLKILALVVALVMTFGIVAACAPGDQELTQPEGPVLRFGGQGWAQRFNPIMFDNVYDNYVSALIFEGLLTNDPEGLPIPQLATWEVSNNNLTYTFTLREGIHFSDGTPLTTQDVAFTFETIAHPDYDGPRGYAVAHWLGHDAFRAGETENFEAIEIIDERTIAFHIAEGNASPANIWHFSYGIMPYHIYAFETWDEFLDMVDTPVGSGKFIMHEQRPMEFINLWRNDNYWNPAELPNIGAVLMLDVPEESILHAFETGDIDIAQPATTIDNYNAFNAVAGVTSRSILDNGFQFLTFNTLRPQLADQTTRQALMYGLDRQAYVDIFLGGVLGSVGLAPLSPASWVFPDDPAAFNDYALDLERAAELFAEAGWVHGADGILERDGVRMELDFLIYPEAPWPGILAGLAYDHWTQLGVDLTISTMDFTSVAAATFDMEPGEKEFDIFVMGWSLAIDPDPSGAIFDYDAFVAGGFNTSGYNNPRAQELLALGRNSFDIAERTAIYQEWAQIQNESVATVVVAYRDALWAVSDRVQGLNIGPFWEWHRDISTITIAE